MKLSVALCTYNAAKFLNQQLESILRQTVQVDEIVICDDGSNDDTEKIVRLFLAENPSRIQYYRNRSNLGPVKNFEECIRICSGDIIFLSDQDDIWVPNKVERMLHFFKEDAGALLVFSDGELIDDGNNLIGGTLWEKWQFNKERQHEWTDSSKAFLSMVNNKNYITGAAAAFKKELKKYMFPFSLPHLYYHDAWLGLLAAGFNGLRFTEECLIQYRVHAAQQVGVGSGVALEKNGPVQPDNSISMAKFQRRVYKIFPQLKPKEKISLRRRVSILLGR